jgi:hypothetical protein
VGEEAQVVPAFVFCGRMVVGFDAEETPGAPRRHQRIALRHAHPPARRSTQQRPHPRRGYPADSTPKRSRCPY